VPQKRTIVPMIKALAEVSLGLFSLGILEPRVVTSVDDPA
jgi:hypothetical protein